MTKETRTYNKFEFKRLNCLRCDKVFKGTIDNRICGRCHFKMNEPFEPSYLYDDTKHMGIWEKK